MVRRWSLVLLSFSLQLPDCEWTSLNVVYVSDGYLFPKIILCLVLLSLRSLSRFLVISVCDRPEPIWFDAAVRTNWHHMINTNKYCGCVFYLSFRIGFYRHFNWTSRVKGVTIWTFFYRIIKASLLLCVEQFIWRWASHTSASSRLYVGCILEWMDLCT